MAKGCKEQLVDFKFAKWIFEYPNKSKPQILSRLEALPSDKEIIILRSPKAVRAFLKST